MAQSQVFAHAREHVWESLMDFGVLARTLPGIESLEPVDAETCRLSVKVMVPSITGSYDGTVRVVEKQPIESYRLRGEATGRLGWVKGDAAFSLAETEAGTEVSSRMSFQTGGAISGVGQRFMGAIAKSMIKEFFRSFERELEAGAVR